MRLFIPLPLRLSMVILTILLLHLLPSTAPAAQACIEIVTIDSPSIVGPGDHFRPKVTVKVLCGQLLESRGDMLRQYSGDSYGGFPHVAVVGSVNPGQTYTFEFYQDLIAPQSEGDYSTTYRIWRNGNWDGPEAVIRFRVSNNRGGGGFPGDPPPNYATPLPSSQAPNPAGSGFTWPLATGSVTGYIGYADNDTHCYTPSGVHGIHHAQDFGFQAENGTNVFPEVYAVADGKVVAKNYDAAGWGNYVIIWHVLPDGGKDKDVFSVYAHMYSEARVKLYEPVTRGQWIGREDTSGTGANGLKHLHFELRKETWVPKDALCPADRKAADLNFYDPMLFIPKYPGTPVTPAVVAKTVATTHGTEISTQSGTINPGQMTSPFQVLLQGIRALLFFSIDFPGSELEITIYRPNGSIYGSYTVSHPPALITIPNPESGAWSYTVRAIDVPYDNYPYAVSAAAGDIVPTNPADLDNDESDPFHGDTDDHTAPFSALTLTPLVPNGQNGWYISTVQMGFTANDNSGGVGVAGIRYSLDNTTWNTFGEPFTFSVEGATPISQYGIDGRGNREPTQISIVKIDTRRPIVTVGTDQPRYTRVSPPFVVHCSAIDPVPGSGLATLLCLLDNSQIVTNNQTVDLFWTDLGIHSISGSAEDVASWHSIPANVSFELIASVESLQATVDRMCREQQIVGKGICNSLSQKLDAALAARNRSQLTAAIGQLKAEENEVRAQQGKAISDKAARILLMDSDYVISELQSKAATPTPGPTFVP